MTNNTGSSHSDKIESSTDRELSLEQGKKADYSTTKIEELLDAVFSLSPFCHGLCWGGIFTLTSVVSAAMGASLTHFHPVSETIVNLLSEHKFQHSFAPSTSTESAPIPSLTRAVNLLIVGINPIDNLEERNTSILVGDSETILLLRFHPQDHSVNVTSIPPDTQVKIPGFGFGTIKEANNYGGVKMVSQLVSKNLDNIEIDRYIKATPEALLELIDLLGGVEVLVPESFESLAQPEKQPMNLASGWQTLDGKQVAQLVQNSDSRDKQINQIQQQQMLIEAIRKRLHNPTFTSNLTQTVQTLQQYLDTDLTQAEMKALFGFLHQLERDEIAIDLLPGYSPQSKSAQNSFIVSSLKSKQAKSKENSLYSGHSWQNKPIALQNTTDNPELALQVLEYLIDHGFYNVYLSRHIPLQLTQTKIVIQSKDLVAANYLQYILGIGELELSSSSSVDSELTIRIGEDARFIVGEDSFIR